MSAPGAAVAQTRVAVADAVRDARAGWSRRASLVLALVVAALLVPALPLGLSLSRLAADLYLAAAAVGLGLAVGLGGLPVLAQGAFMGIGAFTAALLGARAGWGTEAAVAAGGLAAASAGALVGLATAYLRPALVAVVTFLTAWLVALGLAAFPSISGGAQGIVLPEASLAGIRLTAAVHYVVALVLVVLTVAAFTVLQRRSAGLALAAARQHRPAAEAIGVPVARLRAGAVTACAAVGGVAGALAVQLAGVADAGAYGPLLSFELFVAVVLGGAVSPLGGVVGVAFLALLERLAEVGGLDQLELSRVQTSIAALVVVAVLGVADRGVLPTLAAWRRSRAPRAALDLATRAATPPLETARPSLSARGLTRRFGAITGLAGVDLELAGGSVHALIGPNGSGKTTALRLLAGTIEADAGTVVLDGRDLSDAGLHERVSRGVVATLQATQVFPELTALENAMVGARLRTVHAGGLRAVLATPKSRAADRAARRAGLDALAAVGLAEAAAVPAAELPGAAQRRLMIATALATQPRVVLLDEPAAGAGRAEIDALARLLLDLRASGLAIVLVEHNLRLVRAVADRATALAAGRTIASGSPEDVLAAEAVRRSHLGGARW